MYTCSRACVVFLLLYWLGVPHHSQGGLCQWGKWGGYTAICNQTCAGGVRSRYRNRTCSDKCTGGDCGGPNSGIHMDDRDDVKCGSCRNGGTALQSGCAPYCNCLDEFWDNCCAKECSKPNYCAKKYCTSSTSVCKKCESSQFEWTNTCGSTPYQTCDTCPSVDKVNDAYCLKGGNCLPRCNWQGHDCWPGECIKPEYLATTCQCVRRGFQKHTPNGETTQCKFIHKPVISNCHMNVTSSSGYTAYPATLSGCDNGNDVTVIFAPTHLVVVFDFTFSLPEALPVKHGYIHDFAFGVTGATLQLMHHRRDGKTIILLSNSVDDVAICNRGNFNRENPSDQPVNCKVDVPFVTAVSDAEKVCYRLQVTASGYVRVKDLYNSGSVSGKRFYDSTDTTREVCFITDFTPPAHCSEGSPCPDKILDFGPRIRSSMVTSITSSGWTDVKTGSQSLASSSGISNYKIEIFEIDVNVNDISVNKNSRIYNDVSDQAEFDVSLPEYIAPQMYAIYITVSDRARPDGNMKIARGFVLIDKSSQIKISNTASSALLVNSATAESNHQWQTNLEPIRLGWTGRYYNEWYKATNYLKQIRADPDVENAYDQRTGDLSVLGTTNIDGIIKFQYNYTRKTNTRVSAQYKDVPNFTSQKLEMQRTKLTLADGDEINIGIKVEDIRGNVVSEVVNVKVDSSPPAIGRIAVENQTLHIEATDIHCGIDRIEWSIEESINSTNILSGVFEVIDSLSACDRSECICPTIGDCQDKTHIIDIAETTSAVVHDNASFQFQIKVINKAGLAIEDEFNCPSGCLTFYIVEMPDDSTTSGKTVTPVEGISTSQMTHATVDDSETAKPTTKGGLAGLEWGIWGGIFGGILVVIIVIILAAVFGVRRARRKQAKDSHTHDPDEYADAEAPSAVSGDSTNQNDDGQGFNGRSNAGYDTVGDSKRDSAAYEYATAPIFTTKGEAQTAMETPSKQNALPSPKVSKSPQLPLPRKRDNTKHDLVDISNKDNDNMYEYVTAPKPPQQGAVQPSTETPLKRKALLPPPMANRPKLPLFRKQNEKEHDSTEIANRGTDDIYEYATAPKPTPEGGQHGTKLKSKALPPPPTGVKPPPLRNKNINNDVTKQEPIRNVHTNKEPTKPEPPPLRKGKTPETGRPQPEADDAYQGILSPSSDTQTHVYDGIVPPAGHEYEGLAAQGPSCEDSSYQEIKAPGPKPSKLPKPPTPAKPTGTSPLVSELKNKLGKK